MEIITKSNFDQFREQYGYVGYLESEAFEMFSIYCVVSQYIKADTITKSFLDELCVGNGGDWGIDGFIAIVNGKIVTTEEEVADLLKANGSLNVKFILVQAKTSTKFDVGELGKTLDGAEYLLNAIIGEENLPPCNEMLCEYRTLMEYVYSKSADFEDGENPTLDIYYITCGSFQEKDDFTAKISKTRDYIDNLDLISSFNCHMVGRRELIKFYKETKSQINAEIIVERKMPLPEVENITESYLCLIPFKEYRKLIIDSNSNIISSVFYENVRSYQGDNTVNRAMAEALRSGDINLFTAMNNGVTIIAKKVKTSGVKIHLFDYQVVNGCQTSHVLQQNQCILNIDNLMLIVKIISSNNAEISRKIIIGNNSQTEVKREQLVALLETQKDIEDYYNAQNKFEKLYYERRSKQYKNNETQVPPYKVITIAYQIKAFVSMVMGKPDKVSGYYGSIVEQFDKNGELVFAPSTNPALYYTSALACFRMHECFERKIIHRKYKKIKFHILLAFRLMNEKCPLPAYDSNKVTEYCNYLCEILCNDAKCKLAFNKAVKLIDTSLKREPKNNDRMSESLTRELFRITSLVNKRMSEKEKSNV